MSSDAWKGENLIPAKNRREKNRAPKALLSSIAKERRNASKECAGEFCLARLGPNEIYCRTCIKIMRRQKERRK